MFVDEVRILAQAGHGGKGCVAFLRETQRPKGGPSGGNGGRGGHVILEADRDINNLVAQFYQPRLVAERGEHGMGKGMDGRAGRDRCVKVPCGTMIWRLDPPARPTPDDTREPLPRLALACVDRPKLPRSGEARALGGPPQAKPPHELPHPQRTLVADLTVPGQQFVLCRGGRGGFGNRHFATATRQAPRFAQPGDPGEQGEYLLELRLIADVGLVGYPNAGKSTLLAAISHARPKIAPYPFTTLHPQLGIVEYPDYQRLTVCDVPGLIEGAHRNVGLGHAFLRHIQRCRGLVVLIDVAGTDGREPWNDYRQVLDELALYDPTLAERPRLVIANKMDEPAAESNLRKFKRRIPKTPILPVSAAFGQGLGRFKKSLRLLVEKP